MRQTSRRRTQSHGSRHLGTGLAPAGMVQRRTAAPPTLSGGQVRCPVCRKGVTPLGSGFLRGHKDLFGLKCYNRRPPEPA